MTDPDDYGPAMQALTDRQRSFVMAMIEYPGITQADAARRAGYSDVADGAKVRGHYCAHNPLVQAAIREEAGKRLNSSSLMAANVLLTMLTDEEVDPKDRIKAAGMLLDRSGFGAAQTINVNKHVTDSTGRGLEDRIRKAAAQLLKLGSNPGELLGLPAPVDAEFSEAKE